ncbi:MAG: hypothetical protein AAF221_08380 [Pseudomonadota bacterium]
MVFNSSSSSRTDSEVSERINTLNAEDAATALNSSIGGLRVTGGGKKSETNLVANITQTDFGAIRSAENIATKSLDQNMNAVETALSQANRSVDFAAGATERALDLATGNSAASVSDTFKGVLMLAGVSLIAIVFAMRGR